MSTFLYLVPNLIPSASRTLYPFPQRTQFTSFSPNKPFLREPLGAARFGLGQIQFPDPESAQGLIGDLLSRAESLLYTIADAAVSGSFSDTVTTTTAATKQSSDWLSGVTDTMEVVLKVLKDGLSTLHVPYAYGFAIILLTILVKAATFPLTKKQVESAMAMRSLQPQIKAIQQRYAGDQERIQLETARLYKLAGINPLAGCLPTLATIPIWIGLYRALSNVANEGLLTEGFFWIPSLAGPTTIAARQTGSGTSWLFPFVDGHPPLGWSDTLAYLVLPVLLVISQYISAQIMQSSQSNDPSLKSSQAITKFLPLMIGYFALSVPSGLGLYWFTNNILSTAQQVWLQKLGGAKNPLMPFMEDSDKEQQSQIQKSIFKATTTTKKEAKEEKSIAEGPRPGERFKQIKEQEARRRKKREEEKRKAEEAAASGIQKTDQNIVEEGNEDEIDILDARDRSVNSFGTSSYSSNLSYRVADGDSSSFEEELKGSIRGMENSETSVNHEGAINLHENQDKEKAVARMGTSDDKHSGEESHQERTE